MDTSKVDPRYQSPKELAGSHYEEMIHSKKAALWALSSPDYGVRIAAILVCMSTWKCGSDSNVVQACLSIADSDANDSFRICAIELLGMALESSKRLDVSQFLANVVIASTKSLELRTAAYWALRQIQLGLADVNFDTFFKGTICSVKSILRTFPERFSEESVKSKLLPEGSFPEGFWESANEIDLSFVRQFIGPESGDTIRAQ